MSHKPKSYWEHRARLTESALVNLANEVAKALPHSAPSVLRTMKEWQLLVKQLGESDLVEEKPPVKERPKPPKAVTPMDMVIGNMDSTIIQEAISLLPVGGEYTFTCSAGTVAYTGDHFTLSFDDIENEGIGFRFQRNAPEGFVDIVSNGKVLSMATPGSFVYPGNLLVATERVMSVINEWMDHRKNVLA